MNNYEKSGQELREHCVVPLLRSVIDPTWGVYDWTCEEGDFYLSVGGYSRAICDPLFSFWQESIQDFSVFTE